MGRPVSKQNSDIRFVYGHILRVPHHKEAGLGTCPPRVIDPQPARTAILAVFGPFSGSKHPQFSMNYKRVGFARYAATRCRARNPISNENLVVPATIGSCR